MASECSGKEEEDDDDGKDGGMDVAKDVFTEADVSVLHVVTDVDAGMPFVSWNVLQQLLQKVMAHCAHSNCIDLHVLKRRQ